MHSFNILTSFAIIGLVTSSPITARNMCGSAPSASGTQNPISQPSANTAAACQTMCDANTACQSFVFGMANNAVQCRLFSVPAASVPPQATNLMVFDKACPSVPAVTPTAANPTGTNIGGASGSGNGNKSPSNAGAGGATKPAPAPKKARALKARNQCGAAPTGPSSNTPNATPASPISTPANINTAPACQAQCKANPSCKR